MRRHLLTAASGVLAAAALLVPASAVADTGDRIAVCGGSLDVTTEPNQGWTGSLDPGETFRVQRHSPSGTYAYGFAYGHINRHGWVKTRGLCDTGASASADLVDSRVPVCAPSIHVTTEPNQGWMGTLDHDETFRVRKLSESGTYAYGFAYGHINRVGWVLTSDLCHTGADAN